MRIRKYAKLTPSIIWSTAASPSTPNPPEELMQAHVCVVNRSPWDVPSPPSGNFYQQQQQTFSSFQEEVEDDGDSLVNTMNSESLNDDSTPLQATDYSRQSVDSMKLSSNYDNKSIAVDDDSRTFFYPPPLNTHVQGGQYSINGGLKSSPFPSSTSAETAATKKKNNVNSNNIKDDDAAVGAAVGAAVTTILEPPRRRGRPRKVSLYRPLHAAAMPNPPDYYYYAGFAPRWRNKRRGPENQVIARSKQEDKHSGMTHGIAAGVTSSSSSPQIEYYSSNQDDELELVADYIEDDDDDEVGVERKRVRKPIKARSLKSIIS